MFLVAEVVSLNVQLTLLGEVFRAPELSDKRGHGKGLRLLEERYSGT